MKVEPVKIRELVIDPEVQRMLDRTRVRNIRDDFHPEAVGVITVSRRGDGELVVLDGMHRTRAAEEAGFGDLVVMARILEGLTLPQEAEMFRLLNNTVRPQLIDLFRIRVVEGEPIAVGINDLAQKYGWKITLGSRDGLLSAVAAMERAWKRGVAERTLATVTRAWGHDPSGVTAAILDGLSLVFARYGDTLDTDDLINRLAHYPGGAANLIGKARGLRDLYGSTMSQAMAELLVELYNRRRRSSLVPAWRAT